VTVDDEIGVPAVRHRLVPAAWTVIVHGLVPTAAVPERASVWIRVPCRELMLVDVAVMSVMKVAVVNVVDVPIVRDRLVPAAIPVCVAMPFVLSATHTFTSPPSAGLLHPKQEANVHMVMGKSGPSWAVSAAKATGLRATSRTTSPVAGPRGRRGSSRRLSRP
jgi:hypothetical protein